jgi:hypothetical protein
MIPLRAFCVFRHRLLPPHDARVVYWDRGERGVDPSSPSALSCLLGVENCRRFAKNKKYRGANRGVEPKNAKTEKSTERGVKRPYPSSPPSFTRKPLIMQQN